MTASPETRLTNNELSLSGKMLGASLTVKDLEASLRWYRDVLGFDIARKFERDGRLFAVSLVAGDARVLIAQDDGAKGSERAKGEGFSLLIETEQDIDALAARVQKAGGKLDSDPATNPWGARMFRLHDPDGFKFTISSVQRR